MNLNQTHSPELALKTLQQARTVAVVGVSKNPDKPAHYVPAYLLAQGYRIIPVNASLAGEILFGESVRAALSEISEPVDVVNVFRRSELVILHLEDILSMNPQPGLVWMQLGISNADVTQKLLARNIAVIENRCMLADHKNMGLGKTTQSRESNGD